MSSKNNQSLAMQRAIAAFGELTFEEKLESYPVLAEMLKSHFEVNRKMNCWLEIEFDDSLKPTTLPDTTVN